MGFKSIITAMCACLTILSLNASAALVGRDFDGDLSTAEAYYDDEANLTWLADAGYANTQFVNSGGQEGVQFGNMLWNQAKDWAAALTLDGVGGWRLPETMQQDGGCSKQFSTIDFGFNCSGSEMGNMFYNVLGGVAEESISTTHNSNYYLFTNLNGAYWSENEFSMNSGEGWFFNFANGVQDGIDGDSFFLDAWAVQSGDIGAAVVPIPAAVWLFGSGLLGLIGVARRKKA